MAPTNTWQAKNTKQHKLSNSSDSEHDKGKDINRPDPFELSEAQLAPVSVLVKLAVVAAVAQVLPRREENSHNATGMVSPGTSTQEHHHRIPEKDWVNKAFDDQEEKG